MDKEKKQIGRKAATVLLIVTAALIWASVEGREILVLLLPIALLIFWAVVRKVSTVGSRIFLVLAALAAILAVRIFSMLMSMT